jgi:hypothetical protein
MHAEVMAAMWSQAAAQMTHLILQNPFCFTLEGALWVSSRLVRLGSNVEVPKDQTFYLRCDLFDRHVRWELDSISARLDAAVTGRGSAEDADPTVT